MGDLGWPEILIIAVVIIVLFGSKKLPDAARGLGRSLRIFKTEVKGLHDDDKPAELPPAAPAAAAPLAAPAEPVPPPAAVTTPPAGAPPAAASESTDGH